MLTRIVLLSLLVAFACSAYTTCTEKNSMIRWSELWDPQRYCEKSVWFRMVPWSMI